MTQDIFKSMLTSKLAAHKIHKHFLTFMVGEGRHWAHVETSAIPPKMFVKWQHDVEMKHHMVHVHQTITYNTNPTSTTCTTSWSTSSSLPYVPTPQINGSQQLHGSFLFATCLLQLRHFQQQLPSFRAHFAARTVFQLPFQPLATQALSGLIHLRKKMKPTNPNADTYVEKQRFNTYSLNFQRTHLWNTLTWHTDVTLL